MPIAEQLLPVLQTLLGQAPTQPPPRRSRVARARPRPARQPATPAAGAAHADSTAAAPAPAAAAATARSARSAARGAVVTRFEGANAIVISASPDVQRTLGEVIRQLDMRRSRCWSRRSSSRFRTIAAQQLGVQLFLSGLRGSEHPVRGHQLFQHHPQYRPTLAGAVAARELGGTTTTVTTGTGSTTTTTTGTGSGR